MVSRGGLRRNPHGVVTVADLLNRNARSADRAPGHSPGPFLAIPVGSLLRREGWLPRADGAATTVGAAPKPRLSRATARRGAVAAGVLLAAGSVLATMALTDTEPVGAVAGTADGSYPGQGLLDRNDALAAPGGTALIGPAALRDTLNAGPATPMSWLPVGFPGAIGAPSGAAGAPGSGTASTPAPAPGPAPAPVDRGPTRAASPSTPPAQERTTPPSRGTEDPAPAGGSGGGLTGTVGGAVRDAGGALPAPVGAPVQELGDSVAGSEGSAATTSAPRQTAAPSSGAVGGVGKVAAGLLGG